MAAATVISLPSSSVANITLWREQYGVNVPMPRVYVKDIGAKSGPYHYRLECYGATTDVPLDAPPVKLRHPCEKCWAYRPQSQPQLEANAHLKSNLGLSSAASILVEAQEVLCNLQKLVAETEIKVLKQLDALAATAIGN